MSDDWKPGDLALCVNARALMHDGIRSGPRKELAEGKVYTVNSVGVDSKMVGKEVPCLFLAEVRSPAPRGGFSKLRFIKVTPRKADEFDRWVIRHMTGVTA